jgi:16S rRNA (cytosine967-C5)-methyltransferase
VAISPARAAAFEILALAGEGKGHSDDLLHSARTAALSPADRNLATALVMGTLRWQIALDAAIAKLLARPDQRPTEPVALALRLGAFQLLHMDRIPAHAALNESVELCRRAGHPHAAGMVNAILRKLVVQPKVDAAALRRRTPIFESPAAFAHRLGHPLWLVERWIAAYGRDAALAICEYGQQEPQSGGLFAQEVRVGEATSLPGDPASLFAESAPSSSAALQIALQIDDGSRLVAELAAAAALPAVGDRTPRVWDCCAAPGGKTLVLADRLPGAEIIATDVSARRLAGVQQRLRGYPFAERIVCRVADAAKPATDEALRESFFDLILCDAPCSGTGTLARNPEIRHRLRPADLARHAERQRAILAGALSRLAQGGRLLYSTCSLEPEENEAVVEAVLAKARGVQRVSLETALASMAAAGILPAEAEAAATLARTAVRGGALRTLPGVHPCDGFFAVLLERG